MAKATATCTCQECGATFEKSTTKNNRTDAISWEEWAITTYTQCPSCWGKEQRAIEKETPLTLTVDCDPYSQTVILHFSGNTMPVKDDIKALGGYSFDYMPMIGTFGLFSTKKPNKTWYKQIPLDKIENEMENEIKKAETLNPVLKNNVSDVDLIMFAQVKAKNDEKSEKKAEAIKEIKKPSIPEKLCNKTWNQKIYGKSGSYCFYSDNKKIEVTDEEVIEIKQYLVEKENYKKAISKIESEL